MIRYKNLKSRFFAWMVDSVIIGFMTFFLDLLRFLDVIYIDIIITFISINVLFIYRIILHKRTGQTVGKRITNILVVDSETEIHISGEQSFMREFPPLVIVNFSIIALYIVSGGNSEQFEYSGFGLSMLLIPSILIFGWYSAEIISVFVNSKERVLHDIFANTTVVRK